MAASDAASIRKASQASGDQSPRLDVERASTRRRWRVDRQLARGMPGDEGAGQEEPARAVVLVAAVLAEPGDLRGHVARVEIAAGQLASRAGVDALRAASHWAAGAAVHPDQRRPQRLARRRRRRPARPAASRTRRRARASPSTARRTSASACATAPSHSRAILLGPSGPRIATARVRHVRRRDDARRPAAIACAQVPCEPTSTPTTSSRVTHRRPRLVARARAGRRCTRRRPPGGAPARPDDRPVARCVELVRASAAACRGGTCSRTASTAPARCGRDASRRRGGRRTPRRARAA